MEFGPTFGFNIDPDDFVFESLNIPESCRECPSMERVERHFEKANEAKFILQQIGDQVVMEGMPEELKLEYIEHLRADHDNELEEDGITPEEAIENMEIERRQKLGQLIELIDRDIDKTKKLASDMVAGCHSPLTMRASKEGVEHRVTICTSTVDNPGQNIARIKHRVL